MGLVQGMSYGISEAAFFLALNFHKVKWKNIIVIKSDNR